MKLNSVRFKRLSWKLTMLIGVALLLTTVLFVSSYIGLRKVLECNKAIGMLNDVNQVLLQAVVEEKTFLRDHKAESLKRIESLTRKAAQDAGGLALSLGAHGKEIDSLVQLIGKYEGAIKNLGTALQQVDAEDAAITSAVDRFSAKTTEVIGLINEYESESQIAGKPSRPQVLTLRNVAKSAMIATSQVFTTLKNRLWSRNNIQEFRAECKQTLDEFEKQRKNSEVLVKSLNGKDDGAYLEYLELMKTTQSELNKSSNAIAETWDRKNQLEIELTAISTEVSVLKEGIQTLAGNALDTQNKSTMKWSLVVYSIIVLALIAGGFLVARSIVLPVNRIIRRLTEGTVHITEASRQVSEGSQQLAEGASQQSAAVEETSSSLEEIASMAKQNAQHAGEANQLMTETSQVVSKAGNSMSQLTASMADISKASEETFKIIKTIDEIAFQTNLLALNAAVEAARAGEAGAGFAVVADEVRNLAMRAADAAKNTSVLIEGTVKQIKEGTEVVKKSSHDFSDVASSVGKMAELVGEITAASNEQAQGIDQINKAVSEMDKVVQQNAANAEESASASEEINAQAGQMKEFVADLAAMVGGSGNGKQKEGTALPGGEIRTYATVHPASVSHKRLAYQRTGNWTATGKAAAKREAGGRELPLEGHLPPDDEF